MALLGQKLGEIYVDIKGRTAAYLAQLRQLEGKSESSAKRMSNSFVSAFRGLAALLATGAVARGFVGMIRKASDLNEAMNLVKVTFGEAAQEIKDFAKLAPKAMGESEGSALALLGEIGSLAKSFGFSEKAAASFSKTVLQTAADVGSLKNAFTSEVLVAIRAALVGSSEPMLRFGADTRVTRLEQEALAMGISKTGKNLNTQQRALAAVSAILKDNADALGDFANTSDEFATANKITFALFQTELENAGKAFLPFALKSTLAAQVVIENMGKIGEALQRELIPKFSMTEGGLFDKLTTAIKNMPGMSEGAEFWANLLGLSAPEVPQVLTSETVKMLDDIMADVRAKFETIGGAGSKPLFDPVEGLAETIRLVGQEANVGMVIPLAEAREHAFALGGHLSSLVPVMLTAGEKTDTLSKNMRTAAQLTDQMANAFFQAALHGQNLMATVGSIIKMLAVRTLTAGITSLIPGVGFAQAFAGSFAGGGSFTVPGIDTGKDDKLVVAKTRGGEQVDFTPPGGRSSGGSMSVNIFAPELHSIDDDFIFRTRIMPKIRKELGR